MFILDPSDQVAWTGIPGIMSFNNFFALPIVSVALAATSPYSFPATFESTQPVIQETVEEVSEIQEEQEVNPTTEETDARETATEETAPSAQEEDKPIISSGVIVESRGSIHYTQNNVRLYPVMESVCTCESGRQFHADGTVVRGIVNPQDIGMCQINLKYHGAAADALGYDLFTEEGNIRYTNYLYDQQGTQPWYLSGSCHGLS